MCTICFSSPTANELLACEGYLNNNLGVGIVLTFQEACQTARQAQFNYYFIINILHIRNASAAAVAQANWTKQHTQSWGKGNGAPSRVCCVWHKKQKRNIKNKENEEKLGEKM